jgi:hypothetical protein
MTATPARGAESRPGSTAATIGVLAAALLSLGVAGCTQSSRPTASEQRARYHPPALDIDEFPDVPVLLVLGGYEFDPNDDQLAISLAGGTVRRLELSLVRRAKEQDDPPAAALQRFDVELAGLGWTATAPGQWLKGAERLIIETGRSGRLTTVRVHLRPAAAEDSRS